MLSVIVAFISLVAKIFVSISNTSMLKKLFSLTLALVLSVASTLPAAAETGLPAPPKPPLQITEVYPNALKSTAGEEKGAEFVRLTNITGEAINLYGYGISVKENGAIAYLPDGLLLLPNASVVVFPVFDSLLNGGSTVSLYEPNADIPVQQVTYPKFEANEEDNSWQFNGVTWSKQLLRPETETSIALELYVTEPDPLPPVTDNNQADNHNEADLPEEQPVPEAPDTLQCTATNVVISEIVSNPAGSDTDGGEFVELYNSGNGAVVLDGCSLETDKGSVVPLDGLSVAANGYLAVTLSNGLYNEDGGTVTFITATDELVVNYPGLADDQSYSLLQGGWEISNVMTPNAANQPTPQEPEAKKSVDQLAPCPEGKFRNPETNRCKNIVSTMSSLLPCDPGEVRNPETNRCRKIASLAVSLTPCKPGQERNPATNRCRGVSSATSGLKPCGPGEERNPDTNRCRKVTTGVAGTATFEPTGPSELNNGALIFVSVLAVGYGIYEYRFDLHNWLNKLRNRKG